MATRSPGGTFVTANRWDRGGPVASSARARGRAVHATASLVSAHRGDVQGAHAACQLFLIIGSDGNGGGSHEHRRRIR